MTEILYGLDAETLHEVLGPDPNPHIVACIRFDVLAAIAAIKKAAENNQPLPPPVSIEGHPLVDWLSMSEIVYIMVSCSRK